MSRSFFAGFALAVYLLTSAGVFADDAPRPNILWLTTEDIGPHLGCYGDSYATTPNLDALAARSLRYRHAWSNAPVCAPARTTIISGLYPPCTGSEHMRSMARLPGGMQMFPQYLRAAGYYCTNNSKEDYNLEKPGRVWDESSARAHYRNRGDGQPFFAVFNNTITHESQIRKRPHQLVHDPAQARIPACHPDAPEVRHDWAQYYDNITTMDAWVGRMLAELAENGLADDTIVFFYGDHGSGLPRNKRSACNSGLQVPLIVHVPEKLRQLAPVGYVPGGDTGRLVAFIDLAPTMLSLAGVTIPAHFQGHAFLGSAAGAPQPYLYGFRGRMDERYDFVRSVRDDRYVYVRNFAPHRPAGQHVEYMFETPTTSTWKRLVDAGQLNAEQSAFWQPKAPEELYDLEQDPDEVHNLAQSKSHQAVLERMRAALHAWMLDIRDLGCLPEDELHERSKGTTPYEMGHDPERYPLPRILAVAELASSLRPGAEQELQSSLQDPDNAVRYWGAAGLLMRGETAVRGSSDKLHALLSDPSPSVRVVAAEGLGKFGNAGDAKQAIDVLLGYAPLKQNRLFVSVAALNALDELDSKAAGRMSVIENAAEGEDKLDPRVRDLVSKLVRKIKRDANAQKAE